MHAAIGAHDETDLNFQPRSGRTQQRIGRGQGLGRLRIFATGPRTRMRNIAKLGNAEGSLPDLLFALSQGCLPQSRCGGWQRSGTGRGKCEHQKARPEAFARSLFPDEPSLPVSIIHRQLSCHTQAALSTLLSVN